MHCIVFAKIWFWSDYIFIFKG